MGTRETGALLGPGLKSLVLVVLSVLVAAEPSAKSNDVGDSVQKSPAKPVVAAPDARSDDEERLRLRVDEALKLSWQGISGFGLPPDDLKVLAKANEQENGPKGAATYGEITPMGARVVARGMGLDALGGRQISFVDLGSGVGKLVVQAWLEFPRVTSSMGVELSATRADLAEQAWEALQQDGSAADLRAAATALTSVVSAAENTRYAGVHFVEDDMFAIDLTQATHIYTSSTCFGPEMLGRLATHLAAKDVAPMLEVIASLQPFPHGLEGFEMSHSVEAQMSWTVRRGGTNTVHIYRRAGKTGSGSSEL